MWLFWSPDLIDRERHEMEVRDSAALWNNDSTSTYNMTAKGLLPFRRYWEVLLRKCRDLKSIHHSGPGGGLHQATVMKWLLHRARQRARRWEGPRWVDRRGFKTLPCKRNEIVSEMHVCMCSAALWHFNKNDLVLLAPSRVLMNCKWIKFTAPFHIDISLFLWFTVSSTLLYFSKSRRRSMMSQHRFLLLLFTFPPRNQTGNQSPQSSHCSACTNPSLPALLIKNKMCRKWPYKLKGTLQSIRVAFFVPLIDFLCFITRKYWSLLKCPAVSWL